MLQQARTEHLSYGYNAGSYLYTYPGYGSFYSGGLDYPTSPAIDPAGDIWLFTEGNGYYGYYWGVAEFIGIAAPVVTPMAAAVAANAVGARP